MPKNLASGSDNETVEEVELTGSLVSVSVLAFARFAWLESSAKKKKEENSNQSVTLNYPRTFEVEGKNIT